MGSLDIKSDPEVLEPKDEVKSNDGEPPVDSPTTSDKNDQLASASDSDANDLAADSTTTSSEDDDKKVYPHDSPSSSIQSTSSMSISPLQDSESKNGEKVNEGTDHTSETNSVSENPIQDSDSKNDEKLNEGTDYTSATNSMSEIPIQDSDSKNGEKVNEGIDHTSETTSMSENPLQDSGSKNGEKVHEGTDYTSETPPIQVMERQTTPKYRIPSSVFARKQSTNQDWAMASNESLFSIQMSFNYQDSMNWKSGDLERYLQEVKSIPKSNETGKTHGSDEEDSDDSLCDIRKNHGSRIPDKPKKPKSQENQGRKSGVDARCSQASSESESGKSFTFPVLTGDTDKGGSLEVISESEQPEPEKQAQPKADKPASSWTNCFGCCT